MSIKLDTLSDWRPLAGSIGLRGDEEISRRVKLYLNCEAATSLFVRQGKDDPRFLTTVPAGLSTLEFWAAGDLEIAPADADAIVQWQSTEHEDMVFEGDGETFTQVHERAPRNEALEWMMYQQELNQKRMQAALREEMNQQLAAMREQYEGNTTGVHGRAAAEHPQSGEQRSGSEAGLAAKSGKRTGRTVRNPDDAGGGGEAGGGSDGAAGGQDEME